MRTISFIICALGLTGCAATAPNAVQKGYPAAALYKGALPQCRPDEDVGPCTTDPFSQPNADDAFPDGGFRDVVRDRIRQRRQN